MVASGEEELGRLLFFFPKFRLCDALRICAYLTSVQIKTKKKKKNHTHLQAGDLSFHGELLTFSSARELFLVGESCRNFGPLRLGDGVHLLLVVYSGPPCY